MAQVAQINSKKAAKSTAAAGEKKVLFSAKQRYVGQSAGSAITLYVRETLAGKFRVYALREKNGVAKKEKGMTREFGTRAEAETFYAEMKEQCLAANWKEKAAASGKSAFDVIPMAD